jgi:hypothetical protein
MNKLHASTINYESELLIFWVGADSQYPMGSDTGEQVSRGSVEETKIGGCKDECPDGAE